MRLVELIQYFRQGGSYEQFCLSHSLKPDAEAVEIYMEKPFDLNNQLAFFEIEKTNGSIEFSANGLMYYSLFDFYYFLDVIKESNRIDSKTLTTEEIARKLLFFAINDA